MFHIGEFVQYGCSGVCCVEDIVEGRDGLQNGRKYYLLVPVNHAGGRIYTPVNNEKVVMRRILSAEEIDALVQEIPDLPLLTIRDERSREQCYKEAVNSCSCQEWIRLLKTLYERKRLREAQGKKVTSTDERYMKNTEDKLFGEFAASLGKDRSDVKSYVGAMLV